MQKDLKHIIELSDDYIDKPKDVDITDKVLIPFNSTWGYIEETSDINTLGFKVGIFNQNDTKSKIAEINHLEIWICPVCYEFYESNIVISKEEFKQLLEDHEREYHK